jgi:adenylate kinase
MSQHTFIFLAGVHGVGKTTLCKQWLEPMRFHCVSASSIIKSQNGDVVEAKMVGDIPDNQQKLLLGIQSLRAKHQQLAVDGHFVILNREKQMENVDVSVFHELRPDAIVILLNEPGLIMQRLSSRTFSHWDVGFIEELQTRESFQAKTTAEQLAIPFYPVHCGEEVEKICSEILNRKSSSN